MEVRDVSAEKARIDLDEQLRRDQQESARVEAERAAAAEAQRVQAQQRDSEEAAAARVDDLPDESGQNIDLLA